MKKKRKNQRFLIYLSRNFQSDKKGSHVGIVLSFVIFITFIIFLYSVTEPAIKIQKDKEALLDYVKIELIKIFSSNLITATVTINSTESIYECVKLINLREEIGVDSRLVVKNKETEISKANVSEINNIDLIIERRNTDKTFFKIYNSEEFEELNETEITPCTELERGEIGEGQPEGYSIGLVRSEEYLFEKNVIELIEEYETNYEGLKDQLKIPAGSEFGFGLIYTDKTKIGTEEKEILTNIYATEIPIQYVDEEANIYLGYINIQVW